MTTPAPAPSAPEERFRLLVESVHDYAIFMLDPEGRVQSWNAGAEQLKGYAAAEVLGRRLDVFYPPDALARGWPDEELRRARRDGRVEDEGWRVRKDGSRFWASVVITALFDADGVLQGYAKVTRDLTQRRAHEEALRTSEEQLRLLMGAVEDYAIFMLDADGHVLTWNAGAERINGYRESEVLGRHFSLLFTPEDVAAGVPARELAVARRNGRAEAEGWRVPKSGQQFWASAVITPVIAPDGGLRGYAKVTRNLSEQRRTAELERSSRRMEQFLAMLAHELRNPLAPLRNVAEIMAARRDLPPAMRPVQAMLDRQVRQLTRLVDDLLDVARISTGKIALRHERIDFQEVVAASVETARPAIEAKRQTLALDLPPGPLPLVGDAARLGQALQNLLANGTRYTGPGGALRLSVRREGQALLTTVSDTGIGLAPESFERIFQLFAQEPVPRDPSDSGLGVGLSLAREVAVLHGGSLSASSAGPGQGSSFTMRLPRIDAAEVAPSTPARVAPPRGQRVLVIDDNVDATDTMVAMIELLGHAAQGAYSGDAGLAAAEHFRPDVVLLDLNMPGLDGFAVVRRLRARFGDAITIAAVTGYGREGDQRATLETGFDAHLTKPVGPEQLDAVLARPRPAAAPVPSR